MTETVSSLHRVKRYLQTIQLHSEEQVEEARELSAKVVAFYAKTYHSLNRLEQILGVIQKIMGTVEPAMIAYAISLTGAKNDEYTEKCVDRALNGEKLEEPESESLRKVIARYVSDLQFAEKIQAIGPMAQLLMTQKSLLVAGEFSVFRETCEMGTAAIDPKAFKEFLNSKGMIHHFRM